MRALRALLALAGAAVGLWGGYLMFDSGFDNIVSAAKWTAVGVIAHDALLAPVTLVVVIAASLVLPRWIRGPAAVGLIVLGPLTVLAIPVLGRFGARDDNPTLLDRNYAVGWLVVAALVVVLVALASLRQRPRQPVSSEHEVSA